MRRKFSIKNTMGYRLCAFLDGDSPVEIFRRLIIGSEGTLAFVAEAVFETVPVGRYTMLSLALFPDLRRAAEAVGPLVASGATATELMVAPTLIAAAYNMPGTPEEWKDLPLESAALLIEFRSDDASALDGLEARALEILGAAQARRAAALLARSRGDRDAVARQGGLARAARVDARAGSAADLRGRVRAAGADRARPPRTSARCSASTGSSGRRWPRLGRQPPLHADAELRRGVRHGALRRVHERSRRADRLQVPRAR